MGNHPPRHVLLPFPRGAPLCGSCTRESSQLRPNNFAVHRQDTSCSRLFYWCPVGCDHIVHGLQSHHPFAQMDRNHGASGSSRADSRVSCQARLGETSGGLDPLGFSVSWVEHSVRLMSPIRHTTLSTVSIKWRFHNLTAVLM